MKQKSGMIGVVYAAILSAIAGYFFRMTQLSGGSSVPLIAFSILMVFVFALAAVSLEKKSAYEAVYRPSGQDLTFSLLGALGLIAGCVLSFRGSIAQMLVSLLGLLAGLSLGAGAVLRWKEKKPSAAFSVFVVLFYVAKLFRDFRHWEINPAILDYCFSLFAMIAFMLASYHAGAFSFERGARRRLAFYSLLGVLFGAISLAGAQLPEAMHNQLGIAVARQAYRSYRRLLASDRFRGALTGALATLGGLLFAMVVMLAMTISWTVAKGLLGAVVLAALARRWRFEPDDVAPEFFGSVTLRPAAPIRMSAHRRRA